MTSIRSGLSAALLLATIALPGYAESCPAGTKQIGMQEEEAADAIIDHPVCQIDCGAAQQQAELDRAAIERLRAANEQNQEELSDWTKMNKSAQKDALWAAVEFAMADYAADAERAATSVSKLQNQVAFLTKRTAKSNKQKTRLKYLVELQQARAALAHARVVHVSKKIVDTAASANDAWTVARREMEAEFRVAAKHDVRIREQLQEPGFKEAFTGDPNDAPAMEVLETLSDQAIDDISKASLAAEQYEKLAGPAVRVGIFVRDSAYSALESILSTQRVLQAADVAGRLAQASGVMQERYKKSIDALRKCRTTAR
jgi:hypothetical protein